jgi:hypothetical protein
MTAKFVDIPVEKATYSERLRIILPGNHTFKQKLCMLMQAKFLLQHEYNLCFAGNMDCYVPIIDSVGHQITHLPDGRLIAGRHLLVESLYHCAADDYERKSQLFPSLSL